MQLAGTAADPQMRGGYRSITRSPAPPSPFPYAPPPQPNFGPPPPRSSQPLPMSVDESSDFFRTPTHAEAMEMEDPVGTYFTYEERSPSFVACDGDKSIEDLLGPGAEAEINNMVLDHIEFSPVHTSSYVTSTPALHDHAASVVGDNASTNANLPASDEEPDAPCEDGLDGNSDNDNLDNLEDEDFIPELLKKAGRISNIDHAELEQGFIQIKAVLKDLHKKTGRLQRNIIDLFLVSMGLNRCSQSWWNKYQRMFKHQRGIERARTNNPNATCNECFKAFKNQYKKHWQQILDAETEALNRLESSKTGLRRKREFNTHVNTLRSAAERSHSDNAFETFIITAGSSIHSDSGLFEVIESSGAKNFFSRLPISEDTAIGLFRNWICTLVANEIADELKHQVAADLDAASPVASEVPITTPHLPRTMSQAPSLRAKSESLESISSAAAIPGYKLQIRQHLADQAEKQGCVFAAPARVLPWRNLKEKLIPQGLVILNWPLQVPFPVEVDPTVAVDPSAKKQKSGKSEGIRNIGSVAIRALARACTMEDGGLRLVKMRASDLQSSAKPWIIGVVPPAGANRALGARRLFADGTIDQKGPPLSQDPASSSSTTSTTKANDGDDDSTPKVTKLKQRATAPSNMPAPEEHPPPLSNITALPVTPPHNSTRPRARPVPVPRPAELRQVSNGDPFLVKSRAPHSTQLAPSTAQAAPENSAPDATAEQSPPVEVRVSESVTMKRVADASLVEGDVKVPEATTAKRVAEASLLEGDVKKSRSQTSTTPPDARPHPPPIATLPQAPDAGGHPWYPYHPAGHPAHPLLGPGVALPPQGYPYHPPMASISSNSREDSVAPPMQGAPGAPHSNSLHGQPYPGYPPYYPSHYPWPHYYQEGTSEGGPAPAPAPFYAMHAPYPYPPGYGAPPPAPPQPPR